MVTFEHVIPCELVAAAHEPPPGHPVPRALDLVRLHAGAKLEPVSGHSVLQFFMDLGL